MCVAASTLATGCSDVSFIERVVIENNTVYAARVEVRGREGGWLALTTVRQESTREVREVIDQGDLWVFRFTYAGYESFDVEISRKELEESGWSVEVPQELEEALRGQGVPLPAGSSNETGGS
jgi:hypothetical protein